MVLISTTATVRWNGKTRSHYEELGYIWGGQNNWFEVKIEDLMKTSPVKVSVRCDYCDKIYEKAYREIFRRDTVNKIACNNCSHIKGEEVVKVKYGVSHHTKIEGVRERINDKQRLDVGELMKLEKEKNISFVGIDTYVNNVTDMSYICNDHKDEGIQSGSIANIKKSVYCCKFSANNNGKLRRNLNEVKKIFEDKNLTLLDLDAYKNKDTKMSHYCNKHPKHIQSKSTDSVKNTYNPCNYCRIEDSLYDLSKRMRWILTEWKKNVEVECDYKCALTGNKSYDIHHLTSLSTILKTILEELNIYEYNDISLDNQLIIKDKVKDYHKNIGGICLDKKLHTIFHQEFGYYDNTPEQFDTFVNNYKNGKYRDVV